MGMYLKRGALSYGRIIVVENIYAYWPYANPQAVYILSTGILTWSLFEYLTHRFLFHFQARSLIGKRLVYIFHENHHEFPKDRTRLFMPPVPSIVMASLCYYCFAGFLMCFRDHQVTRLSFFLASFRDISSMFLSILLYMHSLLLNI